MRGHHKEKNLEKNVEVKHKKLCPDGKALD